MRVKADAAKTALNARLKAGMRTALRVRSWEEKVEAGARLREMSKLARRAMREALEREQEQEKGSCDGDCLPGATVLP